MKHTFPVASRFLLLVTICGAPFVNSGCSGGVNAEAQNAWQAMCDSVRLRLKFPVEAEFPPIPEVQIIPLNTFSLTAGNYIINAHMGALHKARGESEDYYVWLEEILSRVEMANQGEEWIIAGWVESPNAMGVRSRIPWYGVVEKQKNLNEYVVKNVELVEID